VKKLDVEVLGWCGYTWSVAVRPVGRNVKLAKTTLEAACSKDMDSQLSGNISGGYSCSQHANCTLPQLAICGIVLCDNITHFRVTFHLLFLQFYLQLKLEVYMHLSQGHLNSVFHDS
jgi:hypothetical protein